MLTLSYSNFTIQSISELLSTRVQLKKTVMRNTFFALYS